ASLEALSTELLPERGLPMRVAAATFRGASGRGMVLLTTGVMVGAQSRGVGEGAGQAAPLFEPIEILTSAFRDGETYVDWQRQRLSIARAEAAPGELRYESVSTLSLAPGAYELRVISRHERANLVGSVYTFV